MIVDALLGVAVFLAAAILDYADSRNTMAVTRGDAHAAARWSVAMYVLGLIGIVSVIEFELWLAAPTALGLYAGTWIAVEPRAESRGCSSNGLHASRGCDDTFANVPTQVLHR